MAFFLKELNITPEMVISVIMCGEKLDNIIKLIYYNIVKWYDQPCSTIVHFHLKERRGRREVRTIRICSLVDGPLY